MFGVMDSLRTDIFESIQPSDTAVLLEKQSIIILNALPQIAWTNDPGGNLTFINQHWSDYTGHSFKETVTSGWINTVHPDDQQRAIEQFGSILSGNDIGEFELRKRNKDGSYRWFLTRLAPIFNYERKIIFWIGTSTNINEFKRVQKQKDEFIDVASHELKTPLTSLKVSMQLISERKDSLSPLMYANLFERAVKSLDKVVSLVDNLLNAGKFNLGQLELIKKPVIVSAFIDEVITDFQLPESFSVIISGSCRREIFADTQRLEQVIANLINNALKYAPASKIINLQIQEDDTHLYISISDSGPGIEAALIPSLFNRYYRIENPDYNNTGLGLGLFICTEIISKHGGKLSVSSTLGIGSTFTFSLPFPIDADNALGIQAFVAAEWEKNVKQKQLFM